MKNLYLLTIFSLIAHLAHSQNEYSGKIEVGLLKFGLTTLQIDPGLNWQGYQLNEEQNGLDLHFVNGVQFGNKFDAGVGVGYLNFEEISGFSVFSDFEYFILKSRLTPILNFHKYYNLQYL